MIKKKFFKFIIFLNFIFLFENSNLKQKNSIMDEIDDIFDNFMKDLKNDNINESKLKNNNQLENIKNNNQKIIGNKDNNLKNDLNANKNINNQKTIPEKDSKPQNMKMTVTVVAPPNVVNSLLSNIIDNISTQPKNDNNPFLYITNDCPFINIQVYINTHENKCLQCI